jgi:hypothetical protein
MTAPPFILSPTSLTEFPGAWFFTTSSRSDQVLTRDVFLFFLVRPFFMRSLLFILADARARRYAFHGYTMPIVIDPPRIWRCWAPVAYWCERPELFAAIADGKTELDRMLAVLKWFIVRQTFVWHPVYQLTQEL